MKRLSKKWKFLKRTLVGIAVLGLAFIIRQPITWFGKSSLQNETSKTNRLIDQVTKIELVQKTFADVPGGGSGGGCGGCTGGCAGGGGGCGACGCASGCGGGGGACGGGACGGGGCACGGE